MKKYAMLLQKINLNKNMYFYKPMNLVVGDLEEIDNKKVFRTDTGNAYQPIEKLNNSNYQITVGVGYMLDEEELLKTYNTNDIYEAKAKYIEDFDEYLHLGINEDNNIILHDVPLEDLYANKDYQTMIEYILNTLEKVLKQDNINVIKPILEVLKQDLDQEIFINNMNSQIPNFVKKEEVSMDSDLSEMEKCLNEAKSMQEKLKKPLERLDNLVGLDNIKEQVVILQSILLRELKTKNYLKEEKRFFNMLFTGNPGTGKTTVASIIAEVLCTLGYLKRNNVAVIGSQDLIGKYVGHTADKTTKLLQENRGGVIIIDEAYTLVADGQSFRDDTLGIILKEMEKNETAFIFVGYAKEMEKFINANSGIASRIQYHMNFENYTTEQLLEIFINKIKNANKEENQEVKLSITKEALIKVKDLIDRESLENNFGNARYIENLYKKILDLNSLNTMECYDDIERIMTFTEDDIPESTIYKKYIETEYQKKIGFHTK